jgi:methyltransferase (TIGR00027 family)
MIEGRPSRTAQRVALRRAAHQLIDRPLVHDDPLALQIIGAEQAAALRGDPRQFDRGPVSSVLRAFLVVRSRIAEDALAAAVASGVEQYVVLGAGLDTFAYRNPFPQLRVFEVDHPATQAWKRERLAEGGLVVPANMVFASLDFGMQILPQVLRDAGLDESKPTFFSWLGVTPYLETATTLETLQGIARFASRGGGVAFDYSVPPESLPLLHRAAFALLAKRVRDAGEPFRGFFEPAQIATALRDMGFTSITDLGGDEINARWLADRTDGLQVGSAGRIIVARAFTEVS